MANTEDLRVLGSSSLDVNLCTRLTDGSADRFTRFERIQGQHCQCCLYCTFVIVVQSLVVATLEAQ